MGRDEGREEILSLIFSHLKSIALWMTCHEASLWEGWETSPSLLQNKGKSFSPAQGRRVVNNLNIYLLHSASYLLGIFSISLPK